MTLKTIHAKLDKVGREREAELDASFHELVTPWPDSDLQLLADADTGPRAMWLTSLCDELYAGADVPALIERYKNETTNY